MPNETPPLPGPADPTWTLGRRALLIAALLAAQAAVRADVPDARVKPLLSVPVEELDHRELDMMTVEYPPGGASKPHRHDAYVLVYVLKGALEMQVTGQPLVHLSAGQTFVEKPNDVHAVSRNASQTEPASFLVVMLKKTATPAPKPPGS